MVEYLHVSNQFIVNESKQEVRLRGVCLGGWLLMENFITGYPATESAMRRAIEQTLGKEKSSFYFDRFREYFITESDIAYIRSLGATVIRIPFNYRLLESDDRPFEYKPEGFAILDRAITWARSHGLYVILDLHAVPGCQNRGWHSDNPGLEAFFWGQKVFEDRAIALWQEIARRYQNDATVAGYNVMNEPDTDDVYWLNHFYRRVTDAIRAIDSRHILFLEGNRTSREFTFLDTPFDSNTVYSSHNYVEPSLNDVEYPGIVDGVYYDKDRLESEYLTNNQWMKQHNVPTWVGEFGSIYSGNDRDSMRVAATADMIDIFEKQGHHWTLWTYKDIGKMGLVNVRPDSYWMRQTALVREAKARLRCDYWIERATGLLDSALRQMAQLMVERVPQANYQTGPLEARLAAYLCEAALPATLTVPFAEQFRDMTEIQIDELMQSFKFENCVPREALANVITAACKTLDFSKE